ncbi:DNA cytosine methyltransferase [Ewingella americana]|uniref:DNA cytosine methyltransferase n=1 Tax=Ewingella americana TaxID=41202 RepID=UPI001F014B02|nr:DNA cytosine methyltransferase [Ewingella americana]
MRDVREVTSYELPLHADLSWASFPCQDLSLAGNGLGIGERDSSADETTRSGAIWPFLDLISRLGEENRKPPILVLENVLGLLTLDKGSHFAAICHQLSKTGYRYGAIIIDAKHFLPQSRPAYLLLRLVAMFPFLNVWFQKNLCCNGIHLRSYVPAMRWRRKLAMTGSGGRLAIYQTPE